MSGSGTFANEATAADQPLTLESLREVSEKLPAPARIGVFVMDTDVFSELAHYFPAEFHTPGAPWAKGFGGTPVREARSAREYYELLYHEARSCMRSGRQVGAVAANETERRIIDHVRDRIRGDWWLRRLGRQRR